MNATIPPCNHRYPGDRFGFSECSRTRLQVTIDRFHLYRAGRGLDMLVPTKDAVEQMRKDIKIELVDSPARLGQLTAFKIAYSGSSPQLAQHVNSELTSLFIDENLNLQQRLSESTTAFLQNQLADARTKLEQSEVKVRAFKAEHFGDLPSQAETNVQIPSGLQTQLQSTQRALDGAKQQKLYLESLHSSGPSPQMLTKELTDLCYQLEEARSRLTEEHPDIVALKDKIAKIEKLKKDEETSKVWTTRNWSGWWSMRLQISTAQVPRINITHSVNLESISGPVKQ